MLIMIKILWLRKGMSLFLRRQMLKYLGWGCHVSKFKCLRERSVKVMVEQIWQNVNN